MTTSEPRDERAPTKSQEKPPQPQKEERPPQQEELLCTICGLRSCWQG